LTNIGESHRLYVPCVDGDSLSADVRCGPGTSRVVAVLCRCTSATTDSRSKIIVRDVGPVRLAACLFGVNAVWALQAADRLGVNGSFQSWITRSATVAVACMTPPASGLTMEKWLRAYCRWCSAGDARPSPWGSW
jgi:hypothetical protein